MKKVIVKFIGVKKYLVTDEANPEKIKSMFRKDLELLPPVGLTTLKLLCMLKMSQRQKKNDKKHFLLSKTLSY